MAGLKTASGEEIDGSFELRVEVEESEGQGDVGQGQGGVGQGQGGVGQGQPRVLTLCVTGDLHVGGLMRRIADAFGQPRDWSDHALWWEQQRRWLHNPSPTLDSLGVGGGSRLLFTPRHRPLRLRFPAGGVLRLRLNFAGTPGRAGGESVWAARWLDVGRSLMEQGVAEDQELLLRFKYPCAMGLDPQDGLRLALLHEEALGALLAEEIECTQEQGMLFAVLQEELGAPPELEEELEIYRPSLWPFRGSRPTRARLSGSSLSLWTPPGPGGPQQELNLNECEVTPEVDLGAQKFGIKLRVRTPGGMSETLLRCRDAPQFSRWFCGCRVASGVGGSPSPTEFTRGVLEVLGVQPDGGDPPGTPSRPPPDPRLLLPPRFQSKLKGKQFTQRFLEVLYQVGPLSPPQARLRFLQAWKDLPGFGMGTFLVRFRGAGHDEVLAVGPSQLLRIDPRSGSVTRSWSYSDLRQWDVNWDSQQVRLWLSGDVTLGLRVLSAPPRVLHQFLGGYLALGGPPRDPQELQRLLEGGYDP
ncbi:fermitin family homolog 3-like isoform X2 [Cinclus cinclus]|uniref:fermitin family homolog 3-like isoform X2 n=1 Tax=Cinclus cinclus TaxID=127875 RepID=UPI002E107CFB